MDQETINFNFCIIIFQNEFWKMKLGERKASLNKLFNRFTLSRCKLISQSHVKCLASLNDVHFFLN
jgi:hypothetical protein